MTQYKFFFHQIKELNSVHDFIRGFFAYKQIAKRRRNQEAGGETEVTGELLQEKAGGEKTKRRFNQGKQRLIERPEC